MKALIIDNEEPIRNELKNLIIANCPKVESVFEANGVKSGLNAITTLNPDIVFLDVEMDDGTGIDLVKQLNGNIHFQLVFITAHNKYAIDAFKLSAIDFLLKPIETSELMNSVDKAEKNIKAQFLDKQLQILQDSISEIKKLDTKIALKDSESIYFVKVSDIIRCEASGAYTIFHIENHKDILMSKGIKEYEDLLHPFGFFRTHHSHLVNIKKITRFDKAEGGILILENNEKVPVSQRKKDSLLVLLSKLP